jgi:hypothetical protein
MWKSFAAAQTMDILSMLPSRYGGRWVQILGFNKIEGISNQQKGNMKTTS